MEVCIVGATDGVGQWLVRAVLASEELSLTSAVARRATGRDVGIAIGDDACGVVVLGDIEEALAGRPDVGNTQTSRRRSLVAAVLGAFSLVMALSG